MVSGESGLPTEGFGPQAGDGDSPEGSTAFG